MNGNEPSDKLVIGRAIAEDIDIKDDDSLEDQLSSIDGDVQDALLSIEEKDYQDALDKIGNAQETINKAHIYLSGKVE